MAFQVGERVGDYEVIGVLGAGGMGQVYKVRNIISNRVEALKILLPDLAQDNEVTERFLREIRVLAALEHPNIAQLRTAQREGAQLLMVMEYIEGNTVDGLLQQGPMPLEWQLHVISGVLSALEYAHQRGVVHRDIKPSNIMMTQAGEVKLMDFGIAKLAADKGLTGTGAAPGSLYYMSPEQIQGIPDLDGRSDIYSLGICLYQMVTGQRPFDAGSQYSLMSAHLNTVPREPIAFAAGVPPSLNAIVMKALAKKPADRFQTAVEMFNAVDAVRREITGQPAAAVASAPRVTPIVAPVPTKNRRGLYMALGSVATVAVLVGALLLVPKFMKTSASGEARPLVEQKQPVVEQPVQPVAETAPSPASTPPPQPPPQPQQQPVQKPVVDRPVQTKVEQPADPQPVATTPARDEAAEARRAKLAELRQDYNNLAIRQATVTSGLDSLQNQMGGAGLRGDMREAAARMNYQLSEARASMQSGDVREAQKHLENAEETIRRLEKFLGR